MEKIKKNIEELLSVMDFSGKVGVDLGGGFPCFMIESEEANFLIGRGGENLKALQQIIRLVANKNRENPVYFMVDINYYQKGRLDNLKETAKAMAREVMDQKRAKWMPPMNSFERRVIHLMLTDIEGVSTESEGDGEERRIVIRPREF